MRLIDADALLDSITSQKLLSREAAARRIIEIIKRATTYVFPEEVEHGEWIKSEDIYCNLNLWKCSLCREEWLFEVDDDVKDLNYNYCPNCGAKMDGGKDEPSD